MLNVYTFKRLFNSIPFMMGIVEVRKNDLFHIIGNHAAANFFGSTVEGIQEQPARKLGMSQPIIELWIKNLRMAGLSQEPAFFEYQASTNGNSNWLSVTVSPVDLPANLSQYGYVIQNTSENKRTEKVQEAIYRIAQSTMKSKSHSDLYLSIHTILQELMPVDNFYIALFDRTQDLISFPYFVDQYDPPPEPQKSGRGLTEYILRTGVPLLASKEVFQQLQQQGEVELVGSDSLGWIGVPLKGEEGVYGVMVAQSYTEGIQYSQKDLEIFEFVSSQIGQAIERKSSEEQIYKMAVTNATLFSDSQRRLRHTQALQMVDLAISNNRDLKTTLNIFLDQVITQLKVDAACVLLLSKPDLELEFSAGQGFKSEALQFTRLKLGEGYAGIAAKEGIIIDIPDLRGRHTDFLRSPHFSAEGFVTYYAIPLMAKAQNIGVLEIYQRTSFHPDPEWLDFAQTLAGQAAIAIENATLFSNLERSNIELTQAYEATIEGWSFALDLRDKETEGHTRRVTALSLRIAKEFGFSDDFLVHIKRGALLHDIGKMGIPDQILLKPGPLTPEEWKIMRMHPEYAREMLAPISYLAPALDIPYCHHEKWDGTGYPRQLKGEQIPLTARIFAVVDVWDALRSDRPYRPGWPENKTLEYIQVQVGKHFDPQVVAVFLSTFQNEAVIRQLES